MKKKQKKEKTTKEKRKKFSTALSFVSFLGWWRREGGERRRVEG